MDSPSNDVRSRKRSSDEFGTKRRALLAAGGAVALSGLAGCAALDGLIDRAGEQVVGTTASAPAAFYPGRVSSDSSASLTGAQTGSDGGLFLSIASTADSHAESDESRVFRTSSGDVRQVPATARAEGREIDLEGWSTNGVTKAKDLNSSRSNKPSTRWWVGPDGDGDDDDDGDGDILVEVLNVELDLVASLAVARDAVERREGADAKRALDAFVDTTENALRPALDKCGSGLCETVRESSDNRVLGVRRASDAVDEGNWDAATRELADVDEIALGDIERLDDELVERRPGRPRFSDIIGYLRGEPTIGERFTVCLPDAKLPGDRGSLAEELTPGRVLAYFTASHEDDGVRTPFHDRYGTQGITYDDEGCIRLDGPVSLHEDISCQNILSAKLDTYTAANRGIDGSSIDGGAVVSGIVPVAMDKGLRLAFVAGDGTLSEPDDLDLWGPERGTGGVSVTQTLVCPVTVTPADCSCPLPGLFYVRRCTHDDQVIYAGGWLLDEGALFEASATLLFDEGPTEIASVTLEDVESEEFGDRIAGQFSRERSRYGSTVISGEIDDADGIPEALLAAGGGKKGYDYYRSKVQDPDSDDDGLSDGGELYVSVTALDAPLVHLDGAAELSDDEKLEHGRGVAGLDSETEIVEY